MWLDKYLKENTKCDFFSLTTFFNLGFFFFLFVVFSFYFQSLFLLLTNRLWSAARPRHDYSVRGTGDTQLNSSASSGFILYSGWIG